MAHGQAVYFHSYAGQPRANIDLPAQVQAADGELTLFADYAHPEERGVPLYLVNRTARSLSEHAQDGDLYLKLEVRLPDGRWQRAQEHKYSGCGNSYHTVHLPPGQHLVAMGYFPKEGAKARVRYASYHSGSLRIHSNEGHGLLNASDIETVRYDDMSRRGVPGSLADFILDRRGPPPSRVPTWQDRVAAMRLLCVLGGVPAARRECEILAGELEPLAKDSTEQGAALAALRQLLSQPWPAEMNKAGLLNVCMETLKRDHQAGAAFGSLEESRDLVWKVLSELGRQEFGSNGWRGLRELTAKDLWKPVIELAASRISTTTQEQQLAIRDLLNIGELADEFLPDAVFEAFLTDANNARLAHNVAATALARRGRYEKLVELGWALPAQSQVTALVAMARRGADPNANIRQAGGVRYPDYDTEENRFWVHCMTTQPVDTADQLSYLLLDSGWNPFTNSIQRPLREYLLSVAAESDQKAEDFELPSDAYRLASAIEFLAAWHSSEDAPAFRALLSHRGYEITHGFRPDANGGGESYRARSYHIRNAAKRALAVLGEPVTSDLVVEVELPKEPPAKPKPGQ